MSYLISIGDKVQFLQPNFIVYDKEGNEVYEKLKPGNIYTVKWKGILSISLEEVEGAYLTEHFRKVLCFYRIYKKNNKIL